MCVVSMISDEFSKSQKPLLPPFIDEKKDPKEWVSNFRDIVSNETIEKLKAEIKILERLLIAAIDYDARTGQPECEVAEKVAFLKAVAKALDFDLSHIGGEFA